MAVFNVVEKFVSINGEGQHAGELAVFIRLRGCNLSCSYCDTRWACTDGADAEAMSEDEIISYVKSTGVRRVTLTGGESVSKSYPEFWNDYAAVGGKTEKIN